MIVVHTRSLVSISPEKSVCSCKSLHVVERACTPTTSPAVIDIGGRNGISLRELVSAYVYNYTYICVMES